jgi:hypothetical protein
MPFEEASSELFVVHSDNKVTHDSVSLFLHFGGKMLLLTLSLFYLLLEALDLLLMLFLSTIELSDIVQINLLSLGAAHLFPNTKCLIHKLLVQSV